MTDPRKARLRRFYYPYLGPNDAGVTAERLSAYFKYPSDSVTLHFLLPVGIVLSDCATTWGQKCPRKDSATIIELFYTQLECLCFLTVMNGEFQVDVYQNGQPVPAQIILASPIPNETEDRVVAISLHIVLQGYNIVHNTPVSEKVELDFKAEVDALVARVAEEEGKQVFVKNLTEKERKRREAIERERRGPDVILDFAHFLRDNTFAHKSRENMNSEAFSMYSGKGRNKNNNNNSGGSKNDPPVRFRYTDMSIGTYSNICSSWTGHVINQDQAHAFGGNIAHPNNPCNPIQVYNLQTFVAECIRLKAHPAYCDAANYWQEGSSDIRLPLDGKHFYRLRYTDTRPGNGNPAHNHHGILDTYLPHFKKPNLENDPNVIAYNILKGGGGGSVNDVCNTLFSSYNEIDAYECSRNLSAYMSKRFWELSRAYKDDPVTLNQELSKAQDEGIDMMFSYFHRDGGVSESHKAILEWFEEFISSNNNSAFLHLRKTFQDLSWFDDKISSMNTSLDKIFATRTLHAQMMVCLGSALTAHSLAEVMGFHVMFCGSHSTGKSWLYFALKKLLIPGTITNTISSSDKADSDGTNLSSDRVEIKDESDPDWLATKSSGGDYGASSRNSRTKNILTTGECEIPRLIWDPMLGRYTKITYVTILRISFWVAFNGDPEKMYDATILDRFFREIVLKEEVDAFREQRALECDDTSNPEFARFSEQVFRRFRHNQALCVLVGQAYLGGIFFRGIDLRVAIDKFSEVEQGIKKQNTGLTTPGHRIKKRYLALCRIFTILNAVSMVFESESSTECEIGPDGIPVGKKFTRYSLKKVQYYLVCTPEIAAFVCTLLTSQFEPRAVSEILTVMRDYAFNPDAHAGNKNKPTQPEEEEEEEQEEKEEKKQEQPIDCIQNYQPRTIRTEQDYIDFREDEEEEMRALCAGVDRAVAQHEQRKGQQQQQTQAHVSDDDNNNNNAPIVRAFRGQQQKKKSNNNDNTNNHSKNKDPDDSNKKKNSLEGASYDDMRKNGFATRDGLYIQKTYGEDKFYTQEHKRTRAVALMIQNQQLSSIGITLDNIESVLKQLERTKYDHPLLPNVQYPGLVYCNNSVRIAACALADISPKESKIKKYLMDSFTKEDLIGKYDVLLGTMDPEDRYHFELYPIQQQLRQRKQQHRSSRARIAINTSYADPASIAVMTSVAGQDFMRDAYNSCAMDLFDVNVVSVVDSSIYENRVLQLRNALGITKEIEENVIRMPISVSDWNEHHNKHVTRYNRAPIYPSYKKQFVNIDKEIKRIKQWLLPGQDSDPRVTKQQQKQQQKQVPKRTEELVEELKTLPSLSTHFDRCISEVTMDYSENPIPKLKRYLSLAEESKRLRKRLRLDDKDEEEEDVDDDGNDHNHNDEMEYKYENDEEAAAEADMTMITSSPSRILPLSVSLHLPIPKHPVVPDIQQQQQQHHTPSPPSSSTSSSSSSRTSSKQSSPPSVHSILEEDDSISLASV